MCDCYTTKCAFKGCRIELPVHISDFCMPRKHVKVYCQRHLPEENVAIFTAQSTRRIGVPKGWKMGVWLLQEPPKEYEGIEGGPISPNIGQQFDIEEK